MFGHRSILQIAPRGPLSRITTGARLGQGNESLFDMAIAYFLEPFGLQSGLDLVDDHARVVFWWEIAAVMGPMTPIFAFAPSVSASTWIELLLAIGLMALMFIATARIIAQAGYSTLWILVPLSPLVLTAICFFILWHDLNVVVFGGSIGFIGISTVGFVWHLDQVSVLLNIGFYLLFAFSRWPIAGTRHDRDDDGPLPTQSGRAVPSGPGSGPVVAPNRVVSPRGMPTSAAGPGAGPATASMAPTPKKQGTQFCPWCGEATPGNRALFHDCGPKDRPHTFCKNCGSALPAGSTECTSCNAN
jgi:hypothetical protein